ncbi:MAG: hypothetical protein AAF039_03075 [Bacteroidota bacterium]
MNRSIMIYGCVLLSSTAIAAVPQGTWEVTPKKEIIQNIDRFDNLITAVDPTIAKLDFFLNPSSSKVDEAYDLDLNKIEYIEEENIELGFNPYDYLPENFDPHTFYFDLASVAFVDEEDLSLGFDAVKYLPIGFDAHKVATDLTSIHFIEEEDHSLGFDTGKYLPQGFSAHVPYFDLNSIPYIEMDDDLDNDFLIPSTADCEVDPF